jgi:hypothetical protein
VNAKLVCDRMNFVSSFSGGHLKSLILGLFCVLFLAILLFARAHHFASLEHFSFVSQVYAVEA